jgi:MFS transporter, Spinster family, sphingosine-1-phosphate transporter
MRAPAYRSYMLSVLLAILAFNYVDRLALSLLLQDIKIDLGLSDTQLGFMSGIAFAVFYSIMGIPIALWADRGNRVTIITVTTAVWCGMVAMCGMAANFLQLLLARIGVAIGEAGCVPPAHSMIAEYFDRAERPRAVARYLSGVPASVLVGYFLAGWVNEFYGWRTTFILLGLPGVALAALAWFTLREPRRLKPAHGHWHHSGDLTAESTPTAAVPPAQPTVVEVCGTLWASRTFRHLLLGFSVIYLFGYGISKWQPAFFIRSHGMQSGELGTWFAATYGLVGLLGMYAGGELASRRAAGNEKLQLKSMAVAFIGFGAVSAGTYLSPDRYFAFAFLAFGVMAFNMAYGPLFATIQTLVPGRMRAMSIAIIYLFANLVGMGLGPLAAGMLSDALQPLVGDESLRYALLALCPGYLWAGWHLWRASKTVRSDLEALQEKAP